MPPCSNFLPAFHPAFYDLLGIRPLFQLTLKLWSTYGALPAAVAWASIETLRLPPDGLSRP